MKKFKLVGEIEELTRFYNDHHENLVNCVRFSNWLGLLGLEFLTKLNVKEIIKNYDLEIESDW